MRFFNKTPYGKIEVVLLNLLVLFVPTQIGKHFWPDFSIVLGLRVDYLSPTLYLTDALILLLFICWVGRRSRSLAKPHQFKKVLSPLFWYLLFVCYLLLTVLLSSHHVNGFYHLAKFIEFSFVSYYVATVIKEKQQYITMLFFFAIGVVGSSLLALTQFITQGSLGGIFYYLGERTFTSQTPGIANASIAGELLMRPYATFSHPNVLAGYLLCVLVLLFCSLPQVKNRKIKILFVATLLVGTSGLLLTLSRIPIALWILFILTFLVIHLLKHRRQIRSSLGILFVLAVSFFVSPVNGRFLETRLTEESVVHREQLFSSAFSLFQQSPILGVGFGNFLPAVAQLPSSFLSLQPVHNIYLLVASETGALGLCFFLCFLGVTYQRLLTTYKEKTPVFSFALVLTMVLLIGLFDHYFLTLQQGQLLFAVIIGLCWTTIDERKKALGVDA